MSPREDDSERFLDRLLAIGSAEPDQLLLPTSDETAWLYTERAEELGRVFRLYQPPLQTLRRILDKQLFAEAATKVGLAVLPSWEPQTPDEVAALAPELPYPILIKRRTHVHHSTNHKGVLVRSAKDLTREYARFVTDDAVAAGRQALRDAPPVFLQQFVSSDREGVCSVSGFIDRTGELFVTRRSTKVFQRSHPVGVGVCFESLPADDVLSGGVRRLCVELGYFGMFEAEFMRFNGSWAVIDFNPRLFNQVALDIHRGMPLPLLACLDAVGDNGALRGMVAGSQAEPEKARMVFADGFTLRAILAARLMTQRISRKDLGRWRSWLAHSRGGMIDVAWDSHDPVPGLVHALSEVYLGLRAIPKFLRLTPRVATPVECPSMATRS
jgi:predicted ATP-grasp superfamily ATP-dependent carboligase